MKVGLSPLLSLVALPLVALAAVALAACAHSNPPQGVRTNPGTAPSGTGPSASGSGPSASGSGPSGRVGPPTPGSPCPSQTPLEPGAGAREAAVAAAEAAVPKRYPPHIDITGFKVADAYAADPSSGYGSIAYGLCGAAVGQRTWVVELSFPKMAPSVDLSAGQLFLSRFPDGWKVWFQYH